MKKLTASLIFGAVLALGLTGCTQAKPTQTFNTAKPNAACLINAPAVKSATIKPGTTLKFSAKPAGCAILFTDNNNILINFNGEDKTTLANIQVKATKQGAYSGEVYVPLTAKAGKYTLAVASGVQSKCSGGANCKAPVTQITVKALAPTIAS